MGRTLAPIVLFVYRRLNHTKRVVAALQSNPLAKDSPLIIYADAARTANEQLAVSEVRAFIKTIEGFQSVKIYEQEKNLGLAQSIELGVTEVINDYGRVIVLEDDVLVAPHFLSFMNQALDRYQASANVWHVSGWNYPIVKKNIPSKNTISPQVEESCFFSIQMNCWGWATWQDRWGYYKKDPHDLINRWRWRDVLRFNLYSPANFWLQVKRNASGGLNTWAVFWYSTLFERKGLCLNPVRSLTHNIGFDGSGMHCHQSLVDQIGLANHQVLSWPESIAVNKMLQFKIMLYLWQPLPLLSRLLKKLF
ncbi:MAG: glycosyltransferase [Cellvibrionales bacterium]|nr:glycosyltransferase [Cellvibrionales bacterium]